MEPLSKEEIDEVESFAQVFFAPIPERWQRLFFTARLGAEFIKQTAQRVDKPTIEA